MKLKKLLPELVSGILNEGFDKEPRAIQSLSIPKIKSGMDLFMIGPENSGKTSALVIGILQQLKQKVEGAPRAIVVTSSKEKAYEFEAQLDLIGKEIDLTTFVVFDQGLIQYQKDMIYEGLDVLIGTPKRLAELLNNMGIPMGEVKMVVFDDAHNLSVADYAKYVYRFADTAEKAQLILAADYWSQDFERIEERAMKNYEIIEVE